MYYVFLPSEIDLLLVPETIRQCGALTSHKMLALYGGGRGPLVGGLVRYVRWGMLGGVCEVGYMRWGKQREVWVERTFGGWGGVCEVRYVMWGMRGGVCLVRYMRWDLCEMRFTWGGIHKVRFTWGGIYEVRFMRGGICKVRFTRGEIYARWDLHEVRFTWGEIYARWDLHEVEYTRWDTRGEIYPRWDTRGEIYASHLVTIFTPWYYICLAEKSIEILPLAIGSEITTRQEIFKRDQIWLPSRIVISIFAFWICLKPRLWPVGDS